jgi:hypothetical protein
LKAALRELFSRRGFAIFALHFLASFGFLSGLVQFIAWAWNIQGDLTYPPLLAIAVIMIALMWGLFRAYPRSAIEYELKHPAMSIKVEVGDLLERDGSIAVGFCDTFDTDTSSSVLIDVGSIQGQLLHRRYGGDRNKLDRELREALTGANPSVEEVASAKKLGKRKRYPIGTVATLGDPGQRIFAVAISKLGNDLIAQSSVEFLWEGLSRTWDAMRLYGQHATISLPLIGTGLSRVSSLNHENVLKLIILSLVSHARDRPICRGVVIVIRPEDRGKVNFLEVEAFLKSLD